MQFYFREEKADVVHVYYNVTDTQLAYLVNHQYKSFPARFFTKKYFCPILSKEYARRVAEERGNWISENTKSVHILRFLVKSKFLNKYAQGSLDNNNARINIPHADLLKLNQQIVGYIEKIETIDLQEFC